MTPEERAAKYPIGTRVSCTQRYREQFATLANRAVSGLVVGYGRDPDQIRVRKDGNKSASTFHWHFWDPIV